VKNIALIGFMGAGKTTVAELLAKKLKADLVETDSDVVRLSGLSSVSEIFDKKGEGYFRELEEQVITETVKKGNNVISCGGGVVSHKNTMEILKGNADVVFLHASFDKIKERLKNTTTRPLFRQEEKAMLLYAERLSIYHRYADEMIDTDDKTPEEIVQIIIDKFGFTYGH
jgi:shikimate kinase